MCQMLSLYTEMYNKLTLKYFPGIASYFLRLQLVLSAYVTNPTHLAPKIQQSQLKQTTLV